MYDDLPEAAVDLGGQASHRAAFVFAVSSDPLAGVNRFANPDPDGTAEAFFRFKVQAERHHAQFPRSILHRFDGDPRGTRSNLFHLRKVMTFAFGKQAHRFAFHQINCRRGKRIEIPFDLRRVIDAAKCRDHAHSAHGRTEDQHVEQWRLGQEVNRAPGGDPDDHRINQRVRVVGDKQDGTRRRNALGIGDLDFRVINSDQPPNHPASEISEA